jgi:hypothetical protein
VDDSRVGVSFNDCLPFRAGNRLLFVKLLTEARS